MVTQIRNTTTKYRNTKSDLSAQIDESYCDLLGGFFTIFAHATRMRMFCALQDGPRTVTDIADYAGISITNASQHLRLMRDKGAVISEKQGQSVFYGIADQRFFHATAMIRDVLIEQIQGKARAICPSPTKADHGNPRFKKGSINQA